LRMLVTDKLGDGARVHPLQRLEALARPSEKYAIDDTRRLVLSQSIDQHLAQVLVDTHAERRLLLDRGGELIEDLHDLLSRYVLELRHRRADALNVLCPHVLEHRRRLLLAAR